jgi:hypothetical protein
MLEELVFRIIVANKIAQKIGDQCEILKVTLKPNGMAVTQALYAPMPAVINEVSKYPWLLPTEEEISFTFHALGLDRALVSLPPKTGVS